MNNTKKFLLGIGLSLSLISTAAMAMPSPITGLSWQCQHCKKNQMNTIPSMQTPIRMSEAWSNPNHPSKFRLQLASTPNRYAGH